LSYNVTFFTELLQVETEKNLLKKNWGRFSAGQMPLLLCRSSVKATGFHGSGTLPVLLLITDSEREIVHSCVRSIMLHGSET